MRKYTPEQLSRILSVAAVGGLGYAEGGSDTPQSSTCCIEQAAYATWQFDGEPFVEERFQAWDRRVYCGYDCSPVPVLRWLESKGLA